jgi:hypothetical protein
MLNEIQQVFADKWGAQIVMCLYIILGPFGIAYLALKSFRRYLSLPYLEHYATVGKVLVFVVWRALLICLLDIFFFHTVIIAVVAATVSVLVSLIIAGYLEYQARTKYGLTIIINNG